MEFNPLPDLLNIGFVIIEIGLFYYGEHLGVLFRQEANSQGGSFAIVMCVCCGGGGGRGWELGDHEIF